MTIDHSQLGNDKYNKNINEDFFVFPLEINTIIGITILTTSLFFLWTQIENRLHIWAHPVSSLHTV